MRITKRQLRRIIREEKAKVLAEQRVRRTVRKMLIERGRKLDPAQLQMLGMTLRNAGADSPELKKGQPAYNSLLTFLMDNDIEGAIKAVEEVAPDANLADLKSQLYLFT